MKSILRTLLIITILLSGFSISACDGHKDAALCPEHSFLIPLDLTNIKKRICNLAVTVPSDYKPIQVIKGVYTESELIEFVPLDESANDYTEIITIHPLIGEQVRSDSLVSNLIADFSKKYYTSILFHEVSSEESSETLHVMKMRDGKKDPNSIERFESSEFTSSSCILKCEVDGREELIGFKYVSGPYDSGGVQHRVKIGRGITQEIAYQKIEAFLDHGSYILDVK